MTPEERFEAWRKSVSKGGTACIGLTKNHALGRAYLAGYQAGAEDILRMGATEYGKKAYAAGAEDGINRAADWHGDQAKECREIILDGGNAKAWNQIAAKHEAQADAIRALPTPSEHSEEKSDG